MLAMGALLGLEGFASLTFSTLLEAGTRNDRLASIISLMNFIWGLACIITP